MAKSLLFCSHGGLLDQDAIFAAAAKRELGLESIVLVHGVAAMHKAHSLGFDKVVNIAKRTRHLENSEAVAEDLLGKFASLELEYHSRPLREDLLVDRWLNGRFSLKWSLKYLSDVWQHAERILSNEDVVAGLGEVNYAAYRLVRRLLLARGIPYFTAYSARLFDRFYLDRTLYSEWPRCVTLYRAFLEQGIPAEYQMPAYVALEKIMGQRRGPAYAEVTHRVGGAGEEPLITKLRRGAAKSIVQYWLSSERRHDGWPAAPLPAEMIPWAGLLRWARTHVRRQYYKHKCGVLSDRQPYALFLLHHSPEYTVDTLGWPYRDQVFLIKRIVESLPCNMILAVKEHVSMLGLRDIGSYGQIASTDGVILLPARINALDLIAGASIVFTISGTAAIEAMVLGIPAIVFSRVFHSNFHGIKRCENLLDLPELIHECLTSDDAKPSEHEKLAALAAMYAASRPGRLFHPNLPWQDEENVHLLQDGFIEELRLQLDFMQTERMSGSDSNGE